MFAVRVYLTKILDLQSKTNSRLLLTKIQFDLKHTCCKPYNSRGRHQHFR